MLIVKNRYVVIIILILFFALFVLFIFSKLDYVRNEEKRSLNLVRAYIENQLLNSESCLKLNETYYKRGNLTRNNSTFVQAYYITGIFNSKTFNAESIQKDVDAHFGKGYQIVEDWESESPPGITGMEKKTIVIREYIAPKDIGEWLESL